MYIYIYICTYIYRCSLSDSVKNFCTYILDSVLFIPYNSLN